MILFHKIYLGNETEQEKIEILTNYLLEHLDYVNYLKDIELYEDALLTALNMGSAICYGYATTEQALLTEANLHSYLIMQNGHIFNLVENPDNPDNPYSIQDLTHIDNDNYPSLVSITSEQGKEKISPNKVYGIPKEAYEYLHGKKYKNLHLAVATIPSTSIHDILTSNEHKILEICLQNMNKALENKSPNITNDEREI